MFLSPRIKRIAKQVLLPLAIIFVVGPWSLAVARPPAEPDASNSASGVVSSLTNGDYHAVVSHFNSQLRRTMPANVVAARWQAFLNSYGSFKQQDGTAEHKRGDGVAVIVRCRLDRGDVDVEVDYEPNGAIGGFDIRAADPSLNIKPPT